MAPASSTLLAPYLTPTRILLYSLASLTGLVAFRVLRALIRPLFSPLRALPCPPNDSFFFGHMKTLWSGNTAEVWEKWLEQYGPVMRCKAFFNGDRLIVTDVRALHHILTRGQTYHKPPQTQRFLTRLLGNGVLLAEGETHRNQRRMLNPGFGPAQVRALTGVFLDKSNEMAEIWEALIDEGHGTAKLDALGWASKATLDIIGLAGFSYQFNALRSTPDSPNELYDAFTQTLKTTTGFNVVTVLSMFFPVFARLPTKQNRDMWYSQAVMRRIASKLVADAKADFASGQEKSADQISATEVQGRDLLSLLVKANSDPSVPTHLRLSDEDVFAQIPTFLIAGHETTATALTWALYALATRPSLQASLRAELRSAPLASETHGCAAFSADELKAFNELPWLDAVARETLRLFSPVPSSIREAVEADEIPIGSDGRTIRVAKGDAIFIPVQVVNRSTELWGPDAHEFRPERWMKEDGVPRATDAIPGVFANLLTFLAGPHACIGWRFSVLELKVLLHAIVSRFEFELGVDEKEIGRKTALVMRPYLIGKEGDGNVLPLIVKRAS